MLSDDSVPDSWGTIGLSLSIFSSVEIWEPKQNFFFTLTFISCLWLFCRHVCLRTMCMPGAQRGPRRSQDSLKLELQTAMSHYGGAGNGDAWSSGRIASDFHHWASPALNSLRRGGEIISYYIIFQMLSTYHACHPLTYATKADQGLTVLKNKISHHFEK